MKQQTQPESPRGKVIGSGFSTALPAGWEDRSVTTLVGPIGGTGFAANVVVLRERVRPTVSIEEYALRQRRAMEAEVPELKVLDERAVRFNGVPAYQRLQRFVRHGHHIQQTQTFILCEDVVFSITCSAALEDFDRNIDSFRLVVDSFQHSN